MCSDWHGADANQTAPTGSQSPSLPAPGFGDGEKPSWGHNAPCSHSEKPCCCSFLITHEPCIVQTPFTTACLSLRSEFRYYWSCLYLFVSPPHSCITVAVTVDNVVWVCYGKPFSIYGTLCIPDLFAHLLRESVLVSCDSLKRKYYLFRKQKLAGGGLNINTTGGEWIAFCQPPNPPKYLQERRKNCCHIPN